MCRNRGIDLLHDPVYNKGTGARPAHPPPHAPPPRPSSPLTHTPSRPPSHPPPIPPLSHTPLTPPPTLTRASPALSAHPLVERERLGLRGLLPPRILTMSQQKQRLLDRYWHGQDYIDPSQARFLSCFRSLFCSSLPPVHGCPPPPPTRPHGVPSTPQRLHPPRPPTHPPRPSTPFACPPTHLPTSPTRRSSLAACRTSTRASGRCCRACRWETGGGVGGW